MQNLSDHLKLHDRWGNVHAHFWNYVDVSQEPDGCWMWLGPRMGRYGSLKKVRAHRLSYEYFNGTEPGDLCVCHHCDEPYCVNPNHLFLGTQQDNIADMDRKGRRVPLCCVGEKNPRARLTEKRASDIRFALENGITCSDFARWSGIARGTLEHIYYRRSWAYVA